MLESRAERSALGTVPDIAAVVDIGLDFLSPKSQLLNHTSKTTDNPSTISAQEACFDFGRTRFIFATRPKSKARNRIRIIIRLKRDFINWKNPCFPKIRRFNFDRNFLQLEKPAFPDWSTLLEGFLKNDLENPRTPRDVIQGLDITRSA